MLTQNWPTYIKCYRVTCKNVAQLKRVFEHFTKCLQQRVAYILSHETNVILLSYSSMEMSSILYMKWSQCDIRDVKSFKDSSYHPSCGVFVDFRQLCIFPKWIHLRVVLNIRKKMMKLLLISPPYMITNSPTWKHLRWAQMLTLPHAFDGAIFIVKPTIIAVNKLQSKDKFKSITNRGKAHEGTNSSMREAISVRKWSFHQSVDIHQRCLNQLLYFIEILC